MKKRLKWLSVVVLTFSFAMVSMGCSKKTETKAPETKVETVETESEEETEMELVRVAADQEIVNIMLVGQDRRSNDSERQRSDAMILVTLNRRDNTVDLTSFMRDTYVEIPGWGGNRLNAAYVFGGIDLMNETFMQNFGVKIDGVVEVDFYDFIEIIDEIGGVDVELYEEEIEVINNSSSKENRLDGAGVHHLNGEQTLAYCRIRKVGNNDFERTERQRKVLQQLFKNAKKMNTLQMLNVLDQVFELLNTNLTDDNLLNLMVEVMDMGIEKFENHNIPEDAGYTSQSVNGMSVLVPDLDACRTLVQEIMGETEEVLETNE